MQVFIRPAFFCALQWPERKTTPQNQTKMREWSVIQLWTISPHTKGKSETLTCEDCRYKWNRKTENTNRKVSEGLLMKTPELKPALLNLIHTCCSFVSFEFWVSLICSTLDVSSENLLRKTENLSPSDQNVQNNEFSKLSCWTSPSVCYRAGLILDVWQRLRRWSNSRAALIAASVSAGLWQLIRPAHQQQPGVDPSPAWLKLIQDG